jgi:hypothetical protein
MGGVKYAVKGCRNSMKIIIGIVLTQNKLKFYNVTSGNVFNEFK